MVGRNVQQDGHVGSEIIHIVELERRQFNNIVFVWLFCDLQGERMSNVSCQSGIVSGSLEYMVDERCRCRLSVRSRDANHLRVRVTAGKFYFADDMNALGDDLLNHRSFVGYARTLDDFVGIENLFFRMMTFFPFNSVLIEHVLVAVLDCSHVGYENIVTFFLG